MRAARTFMRAPRIARASFALFSIALFVGCERKAPGPDECQHLAEIAVGIARDDPRITAQLEAQIDTEIQTCLTRPYDRELIACVETTRRARACLAEYKRRTGQNREPAAP
ncbi:MAG TPA: hypothetical protein VHV51_24250 [Polyangiaceae bacterium]|jgi:hypothetical protein|nr:hypothetical protein [Polyangiaceae bacterium]